MDLQAELNPEQLAAVTHGKGPQLVLAGAGSGKTRVITYRISWLIQEQNVEPSAIVAVTFTNKAATEMSQRVQRLLGQPSLPCFVGTFHRFAVRLLRRYGDRVGLVRGFTILDTAEQLAMVKQALEAEKLEESTFVPRVVLSRISDAKNRLLEPDAFQARAEGFAETRISGVYRRYQGLMRRASAVDFDDLIAFAVKLLSTEREVGERVRERLDYLLVDEFQDTNHAQFRLVLSLVGTQGNLTAVGDEDQGIYRWRGADLNNILEFERGFPASTLRKLERNYRSTQNILDASGAVVSHNRHRHGKRLWTESGPGELIELYKASDEGDEARWVVERLRGLSQEYRQSETAVLVRTNAQTRALEDQLMRQQVPYSLVAGVRFYERAEIKDLIAYLRILRDPRDGLALGRILNQPPRGIGRATQELLTQEAEQLGKSIWDVLRLDQLDSLPARGARALRAFRDLILDLQAEAPKLPLARTLERLLERTAYTDLYRRDDPESAAKLENIREFLSAAQDFSDRRSPEDLSLDDAGSDSPPADQDQLGAFLDHVALVSDVDGWDEERGVALMTLHSAKGLEFEAVFLTGLEEGLLPHFNSGQTEEEIEEERRLLYVGMTRARRQLFLSTCRRRRVAGRYQDQGESPFLAEIPASLTTVLESPNLTHPPLDSRTDGVRAFFSTGQPPQASPSQSRTVRKGSRVRHATLGAGVVLDVEGDGESAKITVFFDRAGKRKLIAKYAGLELL